MPSCLKEMFEKKRWKMWYNIYLRAGYFKSQFGEALTAVQVREISMAIAKKKHNIFVAGRKFELKDCQVFKVYDVSRCQNQKNAGWLKDEIKKQARIVNKGKITQSLFEFLGIDVTHDFDPYEIDEQVTIQENKNMDKIFISHSSEDIHFVEAFVEQVLKLGFGIEQERIFCSSMEGHGIRNGNYIPDTLKEELQKSKLVFLFISQSYKKSEVCLNELGAAWVLFDKNYVIPLILPNCDFDSLGFLDHGRLGTKITDQDRMLGLMDDIKSVLELNPKISLLQKHLKRLAVIVDKTKRTEDD